MEAYNPECLLPTVKYGGGSVMILAAISWYYAGPIINLNGRIAAIDYVDMLDHQVHSMVQMLLPNNDAILRMTIRPNTQPQAFSRFEEHEDVSHQHPSPAQSPDSNIVVPLSSVLDRMRTRILPPSISKANRERRAVQHSNRHYSQLIRV
jgi:hypothetical protein